MIRAIHNAATMTVMLTGDLDTLNVLTGEGDLHGKAMDPMPIDQLAQLIIDFGVIDGQATTVPVGACPMVVVANVDAGMMGRPPFVLIIYSATGYPTSAFSTIWNQHWNRAKLAPIDSRVDEWIEWSEAPRDSDITGYELEGGPVGDLLTALTMSYPLHVDTSPT